MSSGGSSGGGQQEETQTNSQKPPEQNLTSQSAPAPSESESGVDENTGTTIIAKKKGTSQLQIPLTSSQGSGLQIT